MSAILEEFGKWGVYKRSQGRIVRQVTFAALALTVVIGLYRLMGMLRGYQTLSPVVCYGIPLALAAVGLWAAYRIVNMPVFADFLIAVEAEMNKVSWPSRTELFRYSIVVMLMIFVLGFLLWVFDFIWVAVFRFIGIYS